MKFKIDNKKIFQTLHYAYSPFRYRILFVTGLGFIGRLALLANTNIIGAWVDSHCLANEICPPVPWVFQHFNDHSYVIVMTVLAIFGFVATSSFRVIFSRLSAQAVSSIYDEVTYRCSRYPMSFFDQNTAGRVITRFSSDYGNVFRLFGGPLAEFMSIVFDLAVMVILMTVAHPIFFIFIGSIILLNFFIYKINRKGLRETRKKQSALRSPGIAHFAETTQGASTIRSFGRENSFTERFNQLDDLYQKQRLTTTRRSTWFSFQMNLSSAFLLLFVGLSSFYLVQNHIISLGDVGIAFSFILLSNNTITMFFEWLTQFEEAMIGVERLTQFLHLPIEEFNYLPSQTKFKTAHLKYEMANEISNHEHPVHKQENAALKISNLNLRYGPDLPMILKDVSFHVEPGEKLGIVGKTGSGKSSLIQAIYRLYPLESGKISIDHYSVGENIDLNAFREAISFVSQDPILFQGSLRTNLDPHHEFSDLDLIHVLEKVGLRDWLHSLRDQFHYRIEEKGKNLSLGERQLICLARTLLHSAPIVIMDEATSNVDPQSEEIMVKASSEFFKNRTQLIIAHRLSTLEKCDRILWLEHGQIRMIGPTTEVLTEFKKFS